MNQYKTQSTCAVKSTVRRKEMRWEDKQKKRDLRDSFSFLAIFLWHFNLQWRGSVSSVSLFNYHTQRHSAKKNSTNAFITTHTVKKLPTLFTHALHTNFLSSLTIPAHYDGVLMNKSVTDTHTNTFAQNALKVKTRSHLLCGNLSQQHGFAGITLHIHMMSRQTQVICL